MERIKGLNCLRQRKPTNAYKNVSVLLQFQISLMRVRGLFNVSCVLTGAAIFVTLQRRQKIYLRHSNSYMTTLL
jgi:hypothetical protein